MENSVEISAKTVQEAVEKALNKLEANEDCVDIEVIDEGNKGIFGLIGNKMARVKVTMIVSKGEKAKKFLSDVFEKMEVEAEIESFEDEQSVFMTVKSPNIGIIIGRRGETLDALELLTSLAVNRNKESYKRVSIDVENYRQKREESLIRLSDKIADRVTRYKKSIALEPMSSYERKIIHTSLQDNRYVETYSVGDEPNRKVVVALKNKM